jgi:hypothetical protein
VTDGRTGLDQLSGVHPGSMTQVLIRWREHAGV